MWSLYKKEIASFFSSLTGYLVIGVFIIITGLFLWVIPGEMNILYGGYATLESLFYLAPWLYLFLVPAVTMRLFAEEKRTGTIELLYTRPLTELQVVLAKYLAGVTLVVISLLPTMIYFYSVVQLGNPVGNIDYGGTWGSFIGLFFLAAIYVSIGTFCSSLTDNQIVSFVLAVMLCFVFYYGFEALSQVFESNQIKNTIVFMGIDDHYQSISRGVIDSRDIIYFLSTISIITYATRLTLISKKW
ncbi:gliding motility-associated ABC transporter permease subunit GldF [Plebeiibacterium sediminum]|uniref:Gliding motility-associated ABC transporter permease subunit GldF n=1 Tax=Plebeiibacterium sediminum TaxID=2992112 RepID=A0AAE3SFZ0_9BACT|nr:gliding motility-associated ABC transporter permease subunit GldF [Plebeiobacterium sediminum]MCW3787786.1 gliding motility-associated ABC transporter permease subunit GldF [Plebeiobacterium sediminum]